MGNCDGKSIENLIRKYGHNPIEFLGFKPNLLSPLASQKRFLDLEFSIGRRFLRFRSVVCLLQLFLRSFLLHFTWS
ncbi:hypothetical protein L2E82_11974 [Cichorium intybus]|uniref:Uncharacterized protein n=1 Tax=Cichorium intybus TaxID=13427 RepID=A0ACB9GG11_CICIN|nr:hypothetical protein L2E82_11974 [Cichorium intybus]